MLRTQQPTVLHNKNNQSWTQWFVNSRVVKDIQWFLGTNGFDILYNASFTAFALIAAIGTGGWLPILLAIVTTTILVTSISRTIVDAYVIKKSQNKSQLQIATSQLGGSPSSIAGDKRLQIDTSQSGKSTSQIAKESNKKLARFDKANSALYHSMNLLYVFLIVGLPLIGIGMGLLGVVIPALACIPPITTAIGGIMFGFRCAICAVTVFSSTKALSSQNLKARQDFVTNSPLYAKSSEKKLYSWIEALFGNQKAYKAITNRII